MQIDCPNCRRVLEFSGERPSFCAYCGVSLAQKDLEGPVEARPGVFAPADTDPDQTGLPPVGLAETIDHLSRERAGSGGAVAESFPEKIAGYRLIRKLGSGGMGTVFEAEDEVHGRRVAIKLIGSDSLASEESLERFRQEGRLASAVTHPRCVFVLAVDEYQGHPYIVMELMPGSTLQTLVEKQGPLRPEDAIARILDVMDGLRQFHGLGLIHRDVKPSNCFLEREGRVKIGDFGLSKSLDGSLDLTRTGTFIGTPLYASPEQIKRDHVDQRTDVYSVAATLYYLLCGHPPVRAKDAAEALARIASEPAPRLRDQRPEVPAALEAVIHRGLERDPSRRWPSLRDFHNALLPFVPGRLPTAGIGRRVGAFVLDLGLAFSVTWAIVGLVMLFHRTRLMEAFQFHERYGGYIAWAEKTMWIVYFAALEGLGSASLGKWIAGLRVSRSDRGGPPGLARGLVRTLAFFALLELPADLLEQFAGRAAGSATTIKFWAYGRLVQGLGLLALVSTMRRKSGYRGPHEWLSGTRVVHPLSLRRQEPTRRLHSVSDSRVVLDATSTLPEALRRLGSYTIRGVIRRGDRHSVLIGHDSNLNRSVWIVVRDGHTTPPPLSRRNLNRRTRPRWIGGGEDARGRWDAFTAPAGLSLEEVVRGDGLSWRDALPILRELVEELQAARDDDTLPHRLSTGQVWVRAEGGAQLVDLLEESDDEPDGEPRQACPEGWTAGPTADSSDERPVSDPAEIRAIEFLREVARLALEGERAGPSLAAAPGTSKILGFNDSRKAGAEGGPSPNVPRRIRAAVPDRAAVILERLAGVRKPFSSLERLQADLDRVASHPLEVTPLRRGLHLAIHGFFLLPGLFLIFLLSCPRIRPRAFPWDLELVIAIPLFWLLWAVLARGGISPALAGISLVRRDGRPAGRLACAFRASLVWAPLTALLAGSRYIQESRPELTDLSWGLWAGGFVLLLAYAAIALRYPHRGPHDWLSGTVMVPS